MSYSNQQDIKYYLSGIVQDLFIVLGVVLLYLILGTGSFENEINGGDGNTSGIVQFDGFILLFIIFSMAIGSVIFYFIFTKLRSKGIRILYGIVLGFPFILLELELFDLVFASSLSTYETVIYFILSLIVPIFTAQFIYVYISGKLMISIRNIGIVVASVIIGRIMALYFDLIGIVVFAILLSLFDIYSVFKGPLSKIMGEPQKIDNSGINIPPKSLMDRQFSKICKDGTPVLLSYQNTILGIGDVLFFAILLYKSLIVWDWIGLALTSITIIIGSSMTLYFLQRISPLPGLPLPVFLTLIGYGFLYLIFNLN